MIMGLGQFGEITTGIAQAIAQMEGYNTPGTVAQRNNNPGNLRSGPGQIGTSGGFAVFPDPTTGWAALEHQVNLNIRRGLTLEQFFAGGNGYPGYAPSSDSNDPARYAAFVAQQTGIDPNTPLNALGTTTPEPAACDPSVDPTCNAADTGSDGGLMSVLLVAGVAIVGALVIGRLG